MRNGLHSRRRRRENVKSASPSSYLAHFFKGGQLMPVSHYIVQGIPSGSL